MVTLESRAISPAIRTGGELMRSLTALLDGQVVEFPTRVQGETVPVTVTNPRVTDRLTAFSYALSGESWYAQALPLARYTSVRTKTFLADMRIGSDPYLLGAIHGTAHDPRLCIGHADGSGSAISTLDFSFVNGALNILRTKTDKGYRHRGFSTTLMRLAHLVAGRPRRLVASKIINTNPLFGIVAKRLLDSGSFEPFYVPEYALIGTGLFGCPVIGMRVLDPDKIPIVRTRGFELRVHRNAEIDLEITVDV